MTTSVLALPSDFSNEGCPPYFFMSLARPEPSASSPWNIQKDNEWVSPGDSVNMWWRVRVGRKPLEFSAENIPAAAHGVPANNPNLRVLTRPPVLTDVAASQLLSAVQKWDNWLSDCTAEAGSHLLGVIASPLSISHTVCSQELTS